MYSRKKERRIKTIRPMTAEIRMFNLTLGLIGLFGATGSATTLVL
jgi:hypothetical protein